MTFGCADDFDESIDDLSLEPDSGSEPESESEPTLSASEAPEATDISMAIAPDNPAWELGVRSYRLLPFADYNSPTATQNLYTAAEAVDAQGERLYFIRMGLRINNIYDWMDEDIAQHGSVQEPSDQQLASFVGSLSVKASNGASSTSDAKARATAGLIIANAQTTASGNASSSSALRPGGQTPAAASDWCVSDEDVRQLAIRFYGTVALCSVEVAAIFYGGPWAAVFVFILESLAGGFGCPSLYGLLCDIHAASISQDCCNGEKSDYDERTQKYKAYCPFGVPAPTSEDCELDCGPTKAYDPVGHRCITCPYNVRTNFTARNTETGELKLISHGRPDSNPWCPVQGNATHPSNYVWGPVYGLTPSGNNATLNYAHYGPKTYSAGGSDWVFESGSYTATACTNKPWYVNCPPGYSGGF